MYIYSLSCRFILHIKSRLLSYSLPGLICDLSELYKTEEDEKLCKELLEEAFNLLPYGKILCGVSVFTVDFTDCSVI